MKGRRTSSIYSPTERLSHIIKKDRGKPEKCLRYFAQLRDSPRLQLCVRAQESGAVLAPSPRPCNCISSIFPFAAAAAPSPGMKDEVRIKHPLRRGVFLVISLSGGLDHSVMAEKQGSTKKHCLIGWKYISVSSEVHQNQVSATALNRGEDVAGKLNHT